MTLFEHPDFEQAILATADHFGELGLRPSIIEKDYFAPEGMSFARSDALFPPAALAYTIEREYEAQCRQLCFGAYPSWDKVRARFLELRALL